MQTLHDYAERTLAAYRTHARAAIASWRRSRRPSQGLRRFAARLPAGARVLDYGCGIGTDLAWMRAQGFEVEGIDGTAAFVEEAKRRCPGAPIHCARFEEVPLASGRYDGIWSHAALMHVPLDVLRRQLKKLSRALRPGGVLGVTLAWGRRRTFTRRDWIPDRYVAAYSKAEGGAFFEGWSTQHLGVGSHDGRHGRWIYVLASRPPTPTAS